MDTSEKRYYGANEIYKTELGLQVKIPESHAIWQGLEDKEIYETMQEIKQMDAKRKARTDKAEEEKKQPTLDSFFGE